MADYKWKPIEDLPEDWTKLASSELAGLASVWREHYETIKDSKALKQFNERLRREWAIETGIIENLYYIDRGVTLTLIEKGIEASLIPHGTTDKPAELIVPILKDQEEVVTGLFDFVGQQRHLSTSYIKQLHQALTQHQRTTAAKDSFGQMIEVELLRGDWKRLPNNPTKSDGSIHEYCPPEQVASEMDQLIAWHQEHLEKGVPPEVEAAWLHHRFTQIHPFQDGNGRMARTLASLIFLRAGLFPLVIHRDERDEYIDTLEIADQGDLQRLTILFSRIQKKGINQAINAAETVLSEETALERIISVAKEKLKSNKEEMISSYGEEELLIRLRVLAEERLRDLASSLQNQIQPIEHYFESDVETYYQLPKAYLPIVEESISEQAGYHPSFRYESWVKLEIRTQMKFMLALSFHSSQSSIVPIRAVAAFVIINPRVKLVSEVFQFTNKESKEDVIYRFQDWLEKAILSGLNYWQQRL